MKTSATATSPDALQRLLQEYRVSWAGLSSPLRIFTSQTRLPYRHTSLTEVWSPDESDKITPT